MEVPDKLLEDGLKVRSAKVRWILVQQHTAPGFGAPQVECLMVLAVLHVHGMDIQLR